MLADALDARLERLRAKYGIPGVSAAIMFADGSIWRGATGDADVATGVPVTPDTSFSVLVPETSLVGQGGTPDPETRVAPAYPGRGAARTDQTLALAGERQPVLAPPGGSPAALTSANAALACGTGRTRSGSAQ